MKRYKRDRISEAGNDIPDAEALKNRVRDGLLALTAAEREEFIESLETEMRCLHFSMRAYLVPLGIPARRRDEMTPLEVAHLIRFLKINVPQAMPAIERAMASFSVFAEEEVPRHLLAA
jgi:hypothetical protein